MDAEGKPTGREWPTNLTGADFTDANLTGANLRDALIAGANFTRAILSDTRFGEADIAGAVMDQSMVKKLMGAGVPGVARRGAA